MPNVVFHKFDNIFAERGKGFGFVGRLKRTKNSWADAPENDLILCQVDGVRCLRATEAWRSRYACLRSTVAGFR